MIDCPIYLTVPNGETDNVSIPPPDGVKCDGCNCGYLQYESLIPYLPEINDKLKSDPEKAVELEFKLREQIVEISRLFDIEAGVQSGYFSKAHCSTTKIFTTNGTRYLKIPEFVLGTLEVRTMDNVLLDESYYAYDAGHLIFLPCSQHNVCGCSNSCGNKKYRQPVSWPDSCYKVTARWGRECADLAVQKAIREYLIEGYRYQDPVVATATGLPVQRRFVVPNSWETYMRNFKAKRRIYSQFAIA